MSTKTNIFFLVLVVIIIGSLWLFTRDTTPRVEDREPDWLTQTTPNGIFKYPENIGTRYISMVDWPPLIQVLQTPFACTPAGEVNARAGKTELRTINTTDYCVTTVSEGAAGSVYSQHAYLFAKENHTVALTFTVREVQCENYDEVEQSECLRERELFNLDQIVHRIAQTLEINQ